jgi:hypothetical protein
MVLLDLQVLKDRLDHRVFRDQLDQLEKMELLEQMEQRYFLVLLHHHLDMQRETSS